LLAIVLLVLLVGTEALLLLRWLPEFEAVLVLCVVLLLPLVLVLVLLVPAQQPGASAFARASND
jgi:hypothetical protein